MKTLGAGLVALAVAVAAGPLAAQPSAPLAKTAAAKAAERDLWSPGEARYIREWRVRATTDAAPDEATLAPGADWRPYTPWSDVADLSGPAGGAGSAEARKYAYASATVRRTEAGPAEIAVGATVPVKVWVNGRPAGEASGARALVRDANRWPVRLNAGENRILIRSENLGEPWLMTARILAPNQPVAATERLAPALSEDSAGRLHVHTDVLKRTTPVTVTIVAPGGQRVGSASGSRGAVLPFDAAAWPDGPYDIRVAGQDAFGRPTAAYIAWHKGDPAAAARRLLARAEVLEGEHASSGHWRMLRDMLVDRAGADLSRLSAQRDAVQSILMEAAELELGPSAAARPSGFVRLAWVDPVDNSTQFCRVYLPADYDPARRWPTVVNLHGYNPDNPPYVGFWSVDVRHDATAEKWGVIWIEAHGRANSQYVGIGEADVLRCLDEARRRLSVDDERTYLTGESMGGSGTWLIGSRNADRFAAIAPIFGGWDYRITSGPGYTDPSWGRPMDLWSGEAGSSFAGAEQLANTPVFIHHGDADAAVPVAFSRHIVQLMQRWGYDVRYREYPGWIHEDLNYRDETVAWMLKHRRPSAPPKVRIRSTDLEAAKAHWVRVDAAAAPMTMIEADAEMVEPGLLRLDTRNVAAVTLTPPASLLAGAPLRVVWNGEPHELRLEQGAATLTAKDAPKGPLMKRAGLSGGLSDVFTTPFVVVVGTSSPDPQMRRLIRERAERLAGLWRSWQHQPVRMIDDTALTPELERSLSLVLVGGPAENRVARRLAARLPLKVDRDSVTVDGRRFAVSDGLVEMVRPSPLASDRYVMVVAATSAGGMWLWSPDVYWHPIFGYPGRRHDWIVRDGRAPRTPDGLSEDRGWIASGVFDQTWRRDDRWTFLGDETLRGQARLRRMPPRDLIVPATALDAVAGRYELQPGIVIGFRREGSTLFVDPPNGPDIPLEAESATRFTTAGGDGVADFVLGPEGRASQVSLDFAQGVATLRRLPDS
jgi:dienelactone hydrolase